MKKNNAKLTEQELAQIAERCEKATEGPWRRDIYKIRGGEFDGIIADPFRVDDAIFIENAREDIPKLLAEIERLREELKENPVVEELRKIREELEDNKRSNRQWEPMPTVPGSFI